MVVELQIESTKKIKYDSYFKLVASVLLLTITFKVTIELFKIYTVQLGIQD